MGGAAQRRLFDAAALVPNGVICLVSALAFHELTDTIPPRVWLAICSKDRKPQIVDPLCEFVRFGEKMQRSGVGHYLIEGVSVPIFDPAKTVVDLCRYRQQAGKRYQKSPGLTLALEGMSQALRQRKASPAAIANYAVEAGVWKALRPYLEARTTNA